MSYSERGAMVSCAIFRNITMSVGDLCLLDRWEEGSLGAGLFFYIRGGMEIWNENV